MNEVERELMSLVTGYQIRRARQQRKLSQAELAKGIGSQSMISLLESGRQFPLPDVLRLVAERLQDETLLSAAELIASGEWSVSGFTSANQALLADILRSHRGQWHDVHVRLALQLCEHAYTDRLFHRVDEICQMILKHSNDEVSQAKANFYQGSARLFSHQYEDALVLLSRAGGDHRLLDEDFCGRLYYNLGYAYTELDVHGVALWYAKLAADTFLHITDYTRHAKSLGLLGTIQSRLGRAEDAMKTLQDAFDMLERWGMSERDCARIAVSLADVCESVGDIDGAEPWCRRAIDLGIQSSDFAPLCAAYQILCLIHLARAEHELAADAVRSAMAIAKQSDDVRQSYYAFLLATGVLHDFEERIHAAETAYAIAGEAGHELEQAVAADCLAALTAGQDPKGAGAYREAALTHYRGYVLRQSMPSSLFRYLPLGRHES